MRTDRLGNLHRGSRGSVLLEVVLAIALFFMTATFVMSALNGSLSAVRTAQLDADAGDLAVTVLSEVQLGLIPLNNDGPVPIELKGYEGWTWQLTVNDEQSTAQIADLKQIEIRLRHEAEDYTHRTSHLIWNNPNRGLPPEESEGTDALDIPSELGDLPGVLP